MKNQNGSALVLVLGVLLIVSLIGVGLLHQSRLDTKFTRAMGASEHAFGLADGGISVAHNKLPNTLESQTYDGSVLFLNFVNLADSAVVGGYAASGFLKGARTSRMKGDDLGTYYDQLWLIQGEGRSGGSTMLVNAAVTKVDKARYGDY
ncbi:MAG TPA: hypothetical protein VK463_18985 [Desulfomonilaceae bacterium]|nr:hypothetical protein [Desulfomonilaceae bacterium]